MKKFTMILAAGMMAAWAGTASADLSDNFNRADSTDMGPKWMEQTGDFSIASNRAQTAAGSTESLMLGASFLTTHPVITVDFFSGAANSSVSLFARYIDATNNIQVKLSDTNGDASYDHVSLLYGDTGQAWPGMQGGPGEFGITPIATGQLRMNLRFGFLQMAIDPPGPGGDAFSRNMVPNAPGADRYGIGGSGGVAFDNFQARGPEPGSAALALIAAPFLRRRRRA